jgi:hypothetical protein
VNEFSLACLRWMWMAKCDREVLTGDVARSAEILAVFVGESAGRRGRRRHTYSEIAMIERIDPRMAATPYESCFFCGSTIQAWDSGSHNGRGRSCRNCGAPLQRLSARRRRPNMWRRDATIPRKQ